MLEPDSLRPRPTDEVQLLFRGGLTGEESILKWAEHKEQLVRAGESGVVLWLRLWDEQLLDSWKVSASYQPSSLSAPSCNYME